MFSSLSNELQFLLATALGAGSLGIAITTFALPQRAKNRIAPFLLFTGTFSTIFLLSSAILSSITYFNEISWASYISILFFCTGTYILPIPVIYIMYKLLKLRLIIR